jgi:hypothetical protein
MAIDPLELHVVAASDFGHIFIHSIEDRSNSKTLRSRYAPFYSLHFTTINGVSLIFW